ncbi:MAG: DUF3800 domain-containing protein [Actinobacteria bacterium]|nr:DUF3800 domain-containing protein [Actinomycetota bacterium]
MTRRLFRVYVDESGDRGWGGRASEVFVVSAVITPDDEDAALRQKLSAVNKGLGRPASTVLHWAANVKTHAQRKFVAKSLSETDAVFTNVVVVKNSLIGTGSALSDPIYQYNYAIRRLLERVSWYVDDHNGEAIITFAHVRRFPYAKLNSYVRHLKAMGGATEIRWKAIRRWSIDQPTNRRLLQMADLVAGCCYSAVRADEFGDHEPGYLMQIAPRIYRRGTGNITSYGFNVVGKPGCMSVYPWWKTFKATCEKAP